MAKAKKNSAKNNDDEKNSRGPFHDIRFRLLFGILFILLGLYILVALISYFFSWKADQSFTWQNLFSDPSVIVENWAGKTGARIAYIFISEMFGIASLGIPIIIILAGLKLLRLKGLSFIKSFILVSFAIIIISICLGYLFGSSGGYLGNGLGGAHGYYVSHWLNAFMGKIGTGLFLIFVVITYLSLSSHTFANWFLNKLHDIFIKKEEKTSSETIAAGHSDENNSKGIRNTSENNSTNFTEDITKQLSNEGLEIVFHDTENTEQNMNNNSAIEEELELIDNQVDEDESEPDEAQRLLAELGPYDPTLDLPRYQFPTIELLDEHKSGNPEVTQEELISNKNKIVETLRNYKIEISHIKATIGPTVTLYEIIPAPGIRISKIKSLEDDIALSLSALGIRIIAPIPGRGTIGIEVPNRNPEIVSMKSVIANKRFQESTYDLPIVLGKTISNETYVVDLARMPHLLVAGATGQGKSVGLNAIITSLLYKKHPSELKLVLVDPKKVELTLYAKLEKHFLAKLPDVEEPIITDTQKVINTLNSLTVEMDARYDLLKKAHVRNIKEYNAKFRERRLNPEHGHRFLPYIILIIDEFADLIMTAGREIETPIARLAQLARAIGIHLIIATQRPTTNIITGVIKANFPARIAFRVTSMIDSRTILDSPGANQLIGRGDMLISTGSDLIRVQCAFIDTPEIERIVDFVSQQQGYPSAFLLPEAPSDANDALADIDLNSRDSLFEEAARLIVMHQQGSTSLIQRKFSIGYNRAGRIMDQLEKAGIVGPADGSKPRQVLIVDDISLEQLLNRLQNKN